MHTAARSEPDGGSARGFWDGEPVRKRAQTGCGLFWPGGAACGCSGERGETLECPWMSSFSVVGRACKACDWGQRAGCSRLNARWNSGAHPHPRYLSPSLSELSATESHDIFGFYGLALSTGSLGHYSSRKSSYFGLLGSINHLTYQLVDAQFHEL